MDFYLWVFKLFATLGLRTRSEMSFWTALKKLEVEVKDSLSMAVFGSDLCGDFEERESFLSRWSCILVNYGFYGVVGKEIK
jgi:hypothetical protein